MTPVPDSELALQITILSPTAGPLPSSILLVGDIDFIE